MIGVMLALAACRGRPPEIDWRYVAALAQPRVAAGASDDLTAALAIAARDREAWSALADQPLSAFPDGDVAAALVVRWARAPGGLPPGEPLPGRAAIRVAELGRVTLAAGTPEATAAVGYLGARLLAEGHHLLDATIGLSLLTAARNKARAIGGPEIAIARPPGGLVRILAAEALTSKQLIDRTATAEGRAEVARQLLEGFPNAPAPDVDHLPLAAVAERERMLAFWAVALAGARPDEPDPSTLGRVRAAATEPPARQVVQSLEQIAAGYGVP
jgi:hypothetical protein